MPGAVGTIVRSVCGRDRNRVFMIVGEMPLDCEKPMVLVADGSLRTLEKPKKKNLRHLRVLATAESAGTSSFEGDNSELRRLTESFGGR